MADGSEEPLALARTWAREFVERDEGASISGVREGILPCPAVAAVLEEVDAS